MSDIINRLRIAQVASCKCGTKSPVSSVHQLDCLYRVLSDAVDVINVLKHNKSQVVEAEIEITDDPYMGMPPDVFTKLKKVVGSFMDTKYVVLEYDDEIKHDLGYFHKRSDAEKFLENYKNTENYNEYLEYDIQEIRIK